MTKPTVGGYNWRRSLVKAERHEKEARVHLGDAVRLLNGRNPVVVHCLTLALIELGMVQDAHKELNDIDE